MNVIGSNKLSKTNAERQASDRAKKKAAGFKQRTFWIKPEWAAQIEELLKRLKSS